MVYDFIHSLDKYLCSKCVRHSYQHLGYNNEQNRFLLIEITWGKGVSHAGYETIYKFHFILVINAMERN